MQSDQRQNIRFADFEGIVDDLGEIDQNMAVYRVTLPSRGLDPDNWAGRPPPLAPEELYTGPREDGLVSTGEISGEYDGCFVLGCSSMTVVPHGPDAIETWSSNLCCLPPFVAGPRVGGRIWKRNPGTDTFRDWDYEHAPFYPRVPGMTFSADGIDGISGSDLYPDFVRKRPNAQKRSFRKVETKDLAGQWRGCGGMMCCMGLCCSTKKALNEDQYEASTCSSFCCLPSSGSETRTRKYVNGHPTNGFAGGSLNDNDPNLVDQWHRDPGCAVFSGSVFTKKVG